MSRITSAQSTPTTGRRDLAGPLVSGPNARRCSLMLMLALAIPGCLAEERGDPGGIEVDVETQELARTALVTCPNVINDGIGLMRYCRNHNIYIDNSNVERAIIVIHGSGLDADNYYDNTVAQAVAAGVDLSKVDIIAPQYHEQAPFRPWDDYYVWPGGWRYGDDAKTHARSSYEIIDHIIGQLMDHRPNLEMIVVAGQSAGGQFVERYAAGTSVSHPGVHLRFWAANPGGYMWYDATRPEPTCAGYDDYPFGLDARNEYMSNFTDFGLKYNAITRDIFWTVGENDTGLNGGCRANAQGENRWERWNNHRANVFDVCSSLNYSNLFCAVHSARHIEIPGCGHGHLCSWQSDEGLDILFGP